MSVDDKRDYLLLDDFYNNLKEIDTDVFRSDYIVGKTDDLKGSSTKKELIKEHMKKKSVDVNGVENEEYKELLDLSKDTDKFNPFDTASLMLQNKEIKTIIHDLYKKEYKYFVSVGVDELLLSDSTADEGYRFIIFDLHKELNYKGNHGGLNSNEDILFLILSNDLSKKHKYVYSDHLVNEFKNVLKEIVDL